MVAYAFIRPIPTSPKVYGNWRFPLSSANDCLYWNAELYTAQTLPHSNVPHVLNNWQSYEKLYVNAQLYYLRDHTQMSPFNTSVQSVRFLMTPSLPS